MIGLQTQRVVRELRRGKRLLASTISPRVTSYLDRCRSYQRKHTYQQNFFASLSTTDDLSDDNSTVQDLSKQTIGTISPSLLDPVASNETHNDLSELFNTDIFEESWRGKEIFDSDAITSGSFKRDAFHNTWSKKSRSYDNSSLNEAKMNDSLIENPTTSIEKRYNELLQQTHELLDALSGEGASSTTLQLMDFDKVMVQWSQFHSEVDGAIKDDDSSFDMGIDYFVSTRQSVGNDDLKVRASDNCMQLLDALERNYDIIYEHNMLSDSANVEVPKHFNLYPNAASYNLALHALANSTKGGIIAQRAYLILNRILDRCRQYRDSWGNQKGGRKLSKIAAPPEPTIITYNSVIHAIAKSGATNAGFLAEEIFDHMEAWKKECDELNAVSSDDKSRRQTQLYHGVFPNSRTLACLLDAWVNSKTIHGQSLVPERTTVILETALEKRLQYVKSIKGVDSIGRESHEQEDETDELLSFIHSAQNEGFLDDDIVEETVDEDYFDEIAASSSPETSIISAEANDSMNHSDIEVEPFLKPNIVALNTVINAWSTSRQGYNGARRAHQLLDKVEQLADSGDLDLPSGYDDPTVAAVDIDDNSLESPATLRPNVRSYSTLMNVWANVAFVERSQGDEAAVKCEQLLTKMEARGADDVTLRPGLVAYTTCISAWARTRNHHQAASRAENILNRMIDVYYDEGVDELPVLEGNLKNAQHDAPFNSVITAYARSSDPAASDRALSILDRLEASPIEPTAVTYNAVMDACAKHGEPERAVSLLERMKEKCIKPNPTSYNTIINAFSRDETPGSADRAWEYLQKLEKDRLNDLSDFVPTNFSYSSVINAFARASSRSNGGIEVVKKAQEVYTQMIKQIEEGKLQGSADAFANSSFLNCCANVNGPSTEKRTALIMAINAFEEMKKKPSLHGEPNQYTFGTMMKASIRLSSDPDERIRLMENLFVQACTRGHLSRSVLGQFLKYMPPNLSAKAILSQGGSKRDIPSQWYRKVEEKDWPKGMNHQRRSSNTQEGRRRFDRHSSQ
jgi:pentatricopeptide repeat protein